MDRLLQRDTVVIFDSLNYIKVRRGAFANELIIQGYRYEVYCMSRALSTPQCVVHCNTPVEMAREWNRKRTDGFEDALYVTTSHVDRYSAYFLIVTQVRRPGSAI